MNSRVTVRSAFFEKPLVFNNIQSCDITSSRRNIGDTAELVITYNKKWHTVETVDKVFERGTPVKIELGYNGKFNTEFEGKISKIRRNDRLYITLEDEVYDMKRTKVDNMSFASITLSDLCKKIAPGCVFFGNETTLTNVRITESTQFGALNYLKKSYGLDVYFREGKLYIGLAFTAPNVVNKQPVLYHFQKNVAEGHKANLSLQSEEDVRVQFKGISVLKKEKAKDERLTYTAGDIDGGMHTLHFYNISQAELKKLVDEELKRVKFTGLVGDFMGFGLPIVKHSETVELKDTKRPERNGRYFVEAVRVVYNQSEGFKRNITIGRRANG